MPLPRLYLSRDTEFDFLSAIEFGSVDDGQPSDAWRVVNGQVGFLAEEPSGRCIGFSVQGFSEFDPQNPEFASIWWDEPRFDVPQLGLRGANAGEICMAAQAWLRDEATLNRCYFQQAIQAGAEGDLILAATEWQLCLESGDLMAHYGLGYTLFELGDLRGAYRHLRAYTEISPANAWAWCWLGRACLALDRHDEARSALTKSLELEARGGDETDAEELLADILPA